MNITDLHGVVPPTVTPLTVDRELDVPSFERMLERMLAAGVNGIFVLGSTSEVAFCTDARRLEILREAARIVGGRVPMLAGIIDTETLRMLEHARAAADLGYDAVVATAPFYALQGMAEVDRHFEILGERAGLPVFAYDIPVCVHTKLVPEQLVELGRKGAIAGVKDSSGDDVSFRRLVAQNRVAGSPLRIFTGHEVCVDGAFLAGADGVVPGLGNVDPAGYVRMYEAYRAGDWEGVRAAQDRLAALMEIAFCVRSRVGFGAGVGSFKTALRELGVIATNQMPEPVEALSGADVEAIRAIIDAAGLVPEA